MILVGPFHFWIFYDSLTVLSLSRENRYLFQVIVLGQRKLATLVQSHGGVSFYLGVPLLKTKPISLMHSLIVKCNFFSIQEKE